MNNRLGPMRPSDRHGYGYKRKDPDYRYGADQVAAVAVDNPEPGSSQKPKNEGPAWRLNQNTWVRKDWNGSNQNASLTFEAMLDGPCRYHTIDPRKPANHSTRNCSWTLRIQADGQKGPGPRAPNRPNYRPNAPLSGANTTPVNQRAPRPAPAKPVNMVDMGNDNGNPGPSQQGGYPANSYREAHQSYMVFVTEPNDKKSELRRAKEVNAQRLGVFGTS